MEPKKEHQEGKYEFSHAELESIADEAAQLVKQIEEVETEKRETASRLGSRVKTLTTQLQHLSQHRRDKYQWRSMECFVEYDLDTQMKRWLWVEDRRLVKERRMTKEELAEQIQYTLV